MATVDRFITEDDPVAADDITSQVQVIQADLVNAVSRSQPRVKRFIDGAGEVVYDRSAQRFIDGGQEVSPNEVRAVLQSIKTRLGNRLVRQTEGLLSGDTALAEWQVSLSEDSQNYAVIAALLGIGGLSIANTYTRDHLEALLSGIQEFLISHITGIATVAGRISDGLYTPNQVRSYTEYKSSLVVGSYNRARKLGIMIAGYNEAKRSLDPTANHCPDCPNYETGWTSIENIVPVGFACRCNGRCRCKVEYRFNPAKAFEGTLIDRVNTSNRFESAVLQNLS